MKKFLKRLFPASRSYVEWRFNELNREYHELEEKYEELNKEYHGVYTGVKQSYEEDVRKWRYEFDQIRQMLLSLNSKLDASAIKEEEILGKQKFLIEKQEYVIDKGNAIEKDIRNNKNEILKNTDRHRTDLMREILDTKKYAQENVWGEVFNNTVTDSTWLQYKTFSPGRWAAGYAFLYILYRTLDEIHPSEILELGLGQTTKMIAQYDVVSAGNHSVVEHDAKWLDFFSRNYALADQLDLIHLELGHEQYKDDDDVLVYDSFKDAVGQEKKYDLIVIDGPFGGQANIYARIDVLKLIPECLSNSFVIIIDDYERKGEINAVKEIKQTLEQLNISYSVGVYRGKKDTCIITSEDYKFLCSL